MKILNIISIISAACVMYACSEEAIEEPKAALSVSNTNVSINETVTFTYTGTNAVKVALYPGDEGHDYSLKDENNTGFNVNSNYITYAYPKAGTYTATIVATNFDEKVKEFKTNIATATVVVNDNETRIRTALLKKDIYNKELEADIYENFIIFAMPYTVRVSNKDVPVKMNAQRISMETWSPTAQLLIDGEPLSSTQKYDLTKDIEVKVIAPSGDEASYNILGIHYPIFDSFSINGVKAKIIGSDYDYNIQYADIVLPKGTDLTNLTPVFETSDDTIVSIDGVDQASGENNVDFSKQVTFTLKVIPEQVKSYPIESKTIVTVTTK